MIKIDKKENCCGCGACIQKCPKQCIIMAEDSEGFYYPVINDRQCIDCDLCESVCPIIGKETNRESVQKVQVGYCPDDAIRMKSSSGGIFSVIAEAVLRSGGVVFGAAFDTDFSVHHIYIENTEELDLLRGSKYLQSRIESTFQQAKEFLDAGREVLFSGTGCQIAGLKSYLSKYYENLLTIDILCHGVPAPKLWQIYLAEKQESYGANVKRVFFRQKDSGWKTYSVSMKFSNDKEYVSVFNKDPYMQMFLRNICLRPSCYACKFKTLYSQADITLGDAWGVDRYLPEMDDDRGASVIYTHSVRGESFLSQVSNRLNLCVIDADQASQPMYSESAGAHPHRARFFSALKEGEDIDKLTKKMQLTFFDRVIVKLKQILR